MTNRTAVYLTPEDLDSTLHPGNRARPAGGRVVREGTKMKRYEAVVHYGPDDEQKRGGFRTLVAAVRWITERNW